MNLFIFLLILNLNTIETFLFPIFQPDSVTKIVKRLVDTKFGFKRKQQIRQPYVPLSEIQPVNITNHNELTLDERYNLNWYVIGKKSSFRNNHLYKIQVWGEDYVVWRKNKTYYAMDDSCSHRGASLSQGKIKNNNIVCPYHGYEFNSTGVLVKVPGLNFTNTACQNQRTYNVVEQDGWVYLNTISKNLYEPKEIRIYREPEIYSSSFTQVLLNFDFNAFGRIISENSLDVMHIGFVHTFGNQKNPSPTKEVPPYALKDYPFHYKTEYEYNSGPDSMAKQVFMVDKLKIENEFILPHTTVARVLFGDYVSTVITSTLPLNTTHSKLFVKTYRNFWNTNDTSYLGNYYNNLGDFITEYTMINTVLQDKRIVENIKHIEGKFNMKYDKLQNVYKTLYKRFVYNETLIV
jgi:phenylpropionate dioxygenase-like ring-hydroxylating dioxygenase large terminal subunit